MDRSTSFVLACVMLAPAACTRAREPANTERSTDAAPTSDSEREELVTIELGLVDDAARERLAARLGPDSELSSAPALLAVHHHIADGWHIYWRNPGESGLRTRLELDTERSEAGATLYPGPDAFTANGGQLSYGWGHDAVLFVPLRALEDGARVSVRSNYLVCRESCIPGQAELDAGIAELAPRSDALTQAMLERIPEPSLDRVIAGWTDGALELVPVGELELETFFPYATDTALFGTQEPKGQNLVLHYRFSGSPPEGAQGVLRTRVGGQTRWLELAVPWPRS